jgi:hypothetical protein
VENGIAHFWNMLEAAKETLAENVDGNMATWLSPKSTDILSGMSFRETLSSLWYHIQGNEEQGGSCKQSSGCCT